MCCKKGSQATGITAAQGGLSSKDHSKMCGSFTRSGPRKESVQKEQTGTDVSRTLGIATVTILVSRHTPTRDNIRSVLPGLRD